LTRFTHIIALKKYEISIFIYTRKSRPKMFVARSHLALPISTKDVRRPFTPCSSNLDQRCSSPVHTLLFHAPLLFSSRTNFMAATESFVLAWSSTALAPVTARMKGLVRFSSPTVVGTVYRPACRVAAVHARLALMSALVGSTKTA
jgi:hypothetical protein